MAAAADSGQLEMLRYLAFTQAGLVCPFAFGKIMAVALCCLLSGYFLFTCVRC